MSKGYFIVDRKIVNKAFELSPKAGMVMMLLIRLANYTPSKVYHNGKTYELQPGELVSSLRQLSFLSGYSIQAIRTIIKQHTSSTLINTRVAQDGMVISICNWDEISRKNFEPTHDQHTDQHAINTTELINQLKIDRESAVSAKENPETCGKLTKPKKAKKVMVKGPVSGLEEHADILADVPQELQLGWIKLIGDVSLVNKEILKCKNWCTSKGVHTKNWRQRLNNWIGNANPSPTETKTKSLPKFEGL